MHKTKQYMTDKHVSIQEASELTGYSKSIIRRWCNSNSIEYVVPGKRKYYVRVNNGHIVFKPNVNK